MTDKPTATSINVTDPHHVQPVFVNDLVGSGQINGVVNLTFATAMFTPTQDGKIDPDIVITARLRMDFYCVQQVHAALGRLIEQNTTPPAGTKVN